MSLLVDSFSLNMSRTLCWKFLHTDKYCYLNINIFSLTLNLWSLSCSRYSLKQQENKSKRSFVFLIDILSYYAIVSKLSSFDFMNLYMKPITVRRRTAVF
jgi:hypothetical protein